MWDLILAWLASTWAVLGQMAPYLLLGFLVAGVLSVLISPAWVERHLGGRGLGPVVKAAVFGVPLPLCSCGVIPVSASIRRHGASRAATTSFLLSTPQTGVDSMLVSYALLGPVFAVYRVVTALATGLLGGALVRAWAAPEGPGAPGARAAPCTDACCAAQPGRGRLSRALHYGFLNLPRDLGPSLLVGVLIAGGLVAFVPANRFGTVLGGGVVSMLLLMAAGIPIYVCATASVPIAVGLIHAGASGGAALAFLASGPATNAAMFTTIWKALGRRSAILFLVVVAASALGGGLLFDLLFPGAAAGVPAPTGPGPGEGLVGWAGHAWAAGLVAVLAVSAADARAHKHPHSGEEKEVEEGASSSATLPDRAVLWVTGMTCAHCAEAVGQAVREVSGVERASVDLGRGRVEVAGRGFDARAVLDAVRAFGYAAALRIEGRAPGRE